MSKSEQLVAAEREVEEKLRAHRDAIRSVKDGDNVEKVTGPSRSEWLKAVEKVEKIKKNEAESAKK